MQVTPYTITLLVLSCLISGATQMITASVVTENKPSLRAYFWFALLLTVNSLVLNVTGFKDSPLVLPISLIFSILPLHLAFHFTGWKLLQHFLIYYAFLTLGDLIMVGLISLSSNEEVMNAVRYFHHPICLLAQVVMGACLLFCVYLYSLIRRMRTDKESLLMIGRCLRIVLTLLLVLLINDRIAPLNRLMNDRESANAILLNELGIVLLFGLSGSYLWQDIKYIILYHQNQTLVQKQQTQDLLLHRSRMFHHNLANILCGLQGTIHRRDFDAIDEYCLDIVKRCQMINNENVQALRQIPRPAVSLLVQQKILDANEAGVPFYVHIDDDLSWRGWRDTDMCQLLGVLLDNAREAAMVSDAPYISLELHNLRSGMELVVRNTWGEQQKKPQPTVDTAPSRGLGLPSIQALLKRYPRTTFSLYHRDRYVEAHLIL